MSVTTVPGFEAAAIASGIKPGGQLDLALVATADRRLVTAVGVFTSNKLKAAPVTVSLEHLISSGNQAAGVIVNSGNANAATGKTGAEAAVAMCQTAGAALGVATENMLVCSTGLIGYQLPIEKVTVAVPSLVADLSSDGGVDAAHAMMTTDTVAKHCAKTQGAVSVGGIAKGAAMLQPNMATMLAVITTDAKLEAADAQRYLAEAVSHSFNTLTVDGAESTNDTVLLLASGTAGEADGAEFSELLSSVCRELAVMMADDAEGSTKTVFVDVVGAVDDSDASRIARRIANCQLIKCSWYGQDPYWGRIAAEAGAAADEYNFDSLSISYSGLTVLRDGLEQSPPATELKDVMAQRRINLEVDLGLGDGSARIITTDLSHAYIDENMGTS